MILVRDIFQLQFGATREALALLERGMEIERRYNPRPTRVLTDLTGEYYTLVIEGEFESLGEMEAILAASFQDPDWRAWYGSFTPLVRSGRREVFRIARVNPAEIRAEAVPLPG